MADDAMAGLFGEDESGDSTADHALYEQDGPDLFGMDADELILETGGEAPIRLRAGRVVNSAGLHAPTLAARFLGRGSPPPPPPYLCKGSYYGLAGRSPFSRLIYPVPVPGGLGVHLTLDLGGQARFGPDVEWVKTIDYEVNPARATSFYPAIRRYWPALPDGALLPGYSGIRPKIVPPGEPAQDFLIQGAPTHGVDGLINLFGIESPGLTSSLAIADHVAALAGAA